MKGLIWIIVLFAAAVGLVLGAQHYSGNVYFVVGQTEIRVNLLFFAAVLLVAMVLLHIALRLLSGTLHLPERFGNWRAGREAHKGMVALNRAGLAYFEGKFEEAEAQAARVLHNKRSGANKTLALMLAAYSADQMNNAEARTRYLQQLSGLPEKLQLSRHLLLAEAALAQHDAAAAEKALQAAAAINPNLTRLVKLQLRFAFDNHRADEVLAKIERLYRAGAVGEDEYRRYSLWAYRDLLAQAATPEALKGCLKRIAADVRENDLVADIAQKYVQTGQYPQAVKWVRKHYPRVQEAALLQPLLQASHYLDDREQQKIMDAAEGWLKIRPQDAQLLLCLGEMACRQKLWGKARGYLEASLSHHDSTAARLLLAQVLEQSGEADAAQAQRNHVLHVLGGNAETD